MYLTTRTARASLAVALVNGAVFAQDFPGRQYPVPTTPRCVYTGDVNNDGNQDIVVGSADFLGLTTLLGAGGLAFNAVPPAPFSFGLQLVVGDFSGDGKLDIVGANGGSVQFGAFVGAGDGTFAQSASLPGGASVTRSLALDIDADGLPESVFLQADGLVKIVTGGASVTQFTGPAGPRGLLGGDVNLDMKTDLVVVANDGAYVLLQVGAATFPTSTKAVAADGCSGGAFLHWDGDGLPDLVVTRDGGGILVCLGNGTGGFAAPIPLTYPKASLALGADLTADGFTDLVSMDALSDTLTVAVKAPGGGVTPPLATLGNRYAVALAAADLSGDGNADVAYVAAYPAFLTGNGNFVSIFRGDGAGHLETSATAAVEGGANACAVGDLGADGSLDIAAASAGAINQTDGLVAAVLTNGAGAIASVSKYSVVPLQPTARGVATGDHDGDGVLDMTAANGMGLGANQSGLSYLAGNSAGGFAAASALATGLVPWYVRVGDFDVNGTLDWAALSQSTPNLVVALNGGAGGALLVKYIPVPSNGAPAALDTGDLNKDGIPDFVVAANGSAAALLASSPGQYAPYAPIATVGTAGSIVLTDFTGDGTLDAVVSSSAGASYVTILPGDGSGSFAPLASRFATPFLLRELAAGDLTGDGKPDLTGAWGGIAVLTNDGQGSIAEQRSYEAGPIPSATALGDVNGDGRLDILAARGLSGGFGAVSVLVQGGAQPAGIQPYGSGTPGCGGTLGLGAVVKPSIGAWTFAVTFTNAPRAAFGILVATDTVDLVGSDPFAVGLKLHLDFFTATQLLTIDCTSDASGAGAAAAPIPNVPALAGALFYAQALWVEAAAGHCTHALANLVASKGLAITIQP